MTPVVLMFVGMAFGSLLGDLFWRRCHHCAWCRRIIWPWQNWVCRGEPRHYYHNTVQQNCFDPVKWP